MGNTELQAKKDEFGKWFFYSVLAVLLINISIYTIANYYDQKIYAVPIWFFISLTLLLAYTGFLLHKGRYNFKIVFTAVFYVFFVLFTYLSLLLCSISEAVFLYYLPVVALFLMINTFKKTFVLSCFLVIFCFFMPEISNYYNISLDKNLYKNFKTVLKFQEYLVVIISAYFTFLILYFMIKFIEIKNKIQRSTILEEDISEINSLPLKFIGNIQTQEEEQDQNKKLLNLYDKIIILFNEEKPYQDTNFNIRKLAELVESNSTYVSKALNQIGNKKFNQLVNEYRIEQVKKEISNNIHQKFTLEHIYTNAGFSQQSTFNRIFKEQVGITPSEYIDIQK